MLVWTQEPQFFLSGAPMQINDQLRVEIQRNVAQALAEDLGTGDLTALLISSGASARGQVVAGEDAILCGVSWFDAVFHVLDPGCSIVWHVKDGSKISSGQVLCEIFVHVRALLSAERLALNFLQLLSSTATRTRHYVDTVAGTRAKIVDTRKTLPGLRLAQKYAVQVGGGINHRMGLYDGILIKENHILAAGGIAQVLQKVRQIASSNANILIEIEVQTLEQLREALEHGAKLILLDQMPLSMMREAVKIVSGRAELEALGGRDGELVHELAQAGLDRISIGCLTKDVSAVNISLRHVEK